MKNLLVLLIAVLFVSTQFGCSGDDTSLNTVTLPCDVGDTINCYIRRNLYYFSACRYQFGVQVGS